VPFVRIGEDRMGRSVVFTRSISLDLLNEVYEEYISGLTKSDPH
jgi:hypothetical protein